MAAERRAVQSGTEEAEAIGRSATPIAERALAMTARAKSRWSVLGTGGRLFEGRRALPARGGRAVAALDLAWRRVSPSVGAAIATTSSSRSCGRSRPRSRRTSRSISPSPTTARTSTPGCGAGSPPRFQLHYTPTYASWLNRVAIWCGLITQRAIGRGAFRSVHHLITKIEAFVQHYNRRCRPFVWTGYGRFDPGEESTDLVKPSSGH